MRRRRKKGESWREWKGEKEKEREKAKNLLAAKKASFAGGDIKIENKAQPSYRRTDHVMTVT